MTVAAVLLLISCMFGPYRCLFVLQSLLHVLVQPMLNELLHTTVFF